MDSGSPAGHPSVRWSWMAAERWVRSWEGAGGYAEVPVPLTWCKVPSQCGAEGVPPAAGGGLQTHVRGGLTACQPLPPPPHLPPRVSFQEEDGSARDGAGVRSPRPKCPGAAVGGACAHCKGTPGEMRGWVPGEVAPPGPSTLTGLCWLPPGHCREERMQQQPATRCTSSRGSSHHYALQHGEGPGQHARLPSMPSSHSTTFLLSHVVPLETWGSGTALSPVGQHVRGGMSSHRPGPGPGSLWGLMLFMALSRGSHCP